MTPFIRATGFKEPTPDLVQAYMRAFSLTHEAALHKIETEQDEIYVNDIYQVSLMRHSSELTQINIRRRDGNVIFRDWRHFQQIKNELVGPEFEAVELYPAESRKVDTSNKYHLWVITNKEFRFPFGWQEREVFYEKTKTKGLRQRPLREVDK